MRKKPWRLLAVATLPLLMAAIGGPALAFFGEAPGDTEVIALRERPATSAGLSLNGVLPGMHGAGEYSLVNAGKSTGLLSLTILPVDNIAASQGEFADGRGDLGANLMTAPFVDLDGDGKFSIADVGLGAGGDTYRAESPRFAPVDRFSGVTWGAVTRLAPGGRVSVIAVWELPGYVGNEVQGDSVSFDIEFTLAQVN